MSAENETERVKKIDINDEESDERNIIFEINGEFLSLGINYIREIIEVETIREIPKLSAKFEGIIHLRKQMIPILNFNYCIFSKSNFEEFNEKNKLKQIIILKTSVGEFGILVDGIYDIINVTDDHYDNIPTAVKTEIPIAFIESIYKFEEKLVKNLNLSGILAKCATMSSFD